MKRLFARHVRHARLLVPLLLLFLPITATAVEKASVTSKAPITMTVKKQQNLSVQGTTVENAKSVSILSARNQAVKAFTTRLSCKAPARKGAKGSCAVNLIITRVVPIGKYSLNLLDAKRQVLAAGQFEVKADPAAARAAAVKKQQAEAKRKAALAAKQKAATDQKKALLAKQKADATRAAAIKKQQAAAKQKAELAAKQKAATDQKRALLAKQKADAARAVAVKQQQVAAKQKAELAAKQKAVADQKRALIAKQRADVAKAAVVKQQQAAAQQIAEVAKATAAAKQQQAMAKQKADAARAAAVKKQQAEARKKAELAAKQKVAVIPNDTKMSAPQISVANAAQTTTKSAISADKTKASDFRISVVRPKYVNLQPGKSVTVILQGSQLNQAMAAAVYPLRNKRAVLSVSATLQKGSDRVRKLVLSAEDRAQPGVYRVFLTARGSQALLPIRFTIVLATKAVIATKKKDELAYRQKIDATRNEAENKNRAETLANNARVTSPGQIVDTPAQIKDTRAGRIVTPQIVSKTINVMQLSGVGVRFKPITINVQELSGIGIRFKPKTIDVQELSGIGIRFKPKTIDVQELSGVGIRPEPWIMIEGSILSGTNNGDEAAVFQPVTVFLGPMSITGYKGTPIDPGVPADTALATILSLVPLDITTGVMRFTGVKKGINADVEPILRRKR